MKAINKNLHQHRKHTQSKVKTKSAYMLCAQATKAPSAAM